MNGDTLVRHLEGFLHFRTGVTKCHQSSGNVAFDSVFTPKANIIFLNYQQYVENMLVALYRPVFYLLLGPTGLWTLKYLFLV